MSFSVEIAPRAQEEFERQLAYIHKRSPKGANAWAMEFRRAAASLSDEPQRCGNAPENADHEQEIRQLVFKTQRGNPYRMLFTIDQTQTKVYILSIRGLGQDEVELNS